MKKISGKTKGMVKGMPSAVLLSILIHAALFLLAGMLVVFTVVKQKEAEFEPPKTVERPKMKLKKPKVKLKKRSKPKSTTRIVTRANRVSMPDIQLPEMSGMGDGLGGGLGGFEIMPDIDGISILGGRRSIGCDLEGTFYDFKRDHGGRYISMNLASWRQEIINFLKRDWRLSTFSRYYRAPNKIYATCLVVPPVLSSIAPSAFGDKDAAGVMWLVHYKGQLVHKDGITFRFVGSADETMAVRVGGKMVLGVRWESYRTGVTNVDPDTIPPNIWESDSMDSRKFMMGNTWAEVGDWITLEPGVPQNIEIIIGDNGGLACFLLAVEEQGVEYPKSIDTRYLPAFKTTPISRDLQDVIYKDLVEGQVCLTNGPVFNDFYTEPAPAAMPALAVETEGARGTEPEPSQSRVWLLSDGRRIEGEFQKIIAQQALLKNAKGKIIKVPVQQFSPDDLAYMELAQPPQFDINFINIRDKKGFSMIRYAEGRPPQYLCHYGMRIRQTGTGNYHREVKAEMFVIGQERLGRKYILLDRQTTSFIPTKENSRIHEFLSEREVVLENYAVDGEPRGETYAGFLIVLTDERGEHIGVRTSKDWLYENLDKLKELHTGCYMDKKCNRVFPTRPPRTR